MEITRKEIGRFNIGISLLQYNGEITPKFINTNFNVPKDVILSQLRLFIKTLENDYYPDFRNNMTTINLGSDE